MRQVDQVRVFNKYLVNLAMQKSYVIKKIDEDDEAEPNDHMLIHDQFIGASRQDQNQVNPSNSVESKVNGDINIVSQAQVIEDGDEELPESSLDNKRQNEYERNELKEIQNILENEISLVDDVEKCQNDNNMVENVLESLYNYSNDQSLHHELINNGIIEVIRKYVDLFLTYS
jgi:hypothetical protein